MSLMQDFYDAEMNGDGDGGGSGRRAYIVAPRRSTTTPPIADLRYIGSEQPQAEAKDDGTSMPEAAQRYLAYKDDPEWKAADDEQNSAMGGTGGLGSAILDRLTHGYYSRNQMSAWEMAGQRKREIQQRYLDAEALRRANQETFDFSKPEQRMYDATEGKFYNVYRGSHGNMQKKEVPRPQETAINERGESVLAMLGPGAKNMVEVTPGTVTASETTAEGPFAGGVAESLTPMPVVRSQKALADTAESKSKIAENDAQTKRALAEAAIKEAELKTVGANVGAGDTRVFANGRTFTAPTTPAQRGERAGGQMSYAKASEQARKEAATAAPKPTVAPFDMDGPAKLDAWKARYDTEFDKALSRILANSGITPAATDEQPPSTKPSSIGKPGKRQKVAFNANGELVDVN